MPVSATLVRALAAAGQDVASLVPPGVASYIARHHLYRPT
jgi:nicotinate-nucleotide adenylyltransferase